jgi:hypothetical protein
MWLGIPKMNPERERSRSYPVIDLEGALDLLGRLGLLEAEEVDRKDLAKLLGYTTGNGGVAARKVGALVQYGLIDRHAGRYGLSLRGRRLRKAGKSPSEYRAGIQAALERPPLFRWILERYRRVGSVPENLNGVLAREYGVTARASEEAANVFLRSARFAGVLDPEGLFIEAVASAGNDARRPTDGEITLAMQSPAPSDTTDTWKGRLELPLTNRRAAWLIFPSILTEEDLEVLEKRLRFELDAETLRKYVTVDPRSADGNVIPVGFGSRAKRPKT